MSIQRQHPRTRGVLSRGKRIDNGDWITGVRMSDSLIVPFGQELDPMPVTGGMVDVSVIAVVVDPETIGKQIGRVDEAGVDVFEGDIIEVVDLRGCFLKSFRGAVVYQNCSYAIDDGVCVHYRWADYKVTVVGNIYDNPELITMEV